MLLTLWGLFGVLVSFGQTVQQFPMEEFIGVNLRREDPIQYLNAFGFVREYRDWAVDEGNSVTLTNPPPQPLPLNKYRWNPGFGTPTRFDDFYDNIISRIGNGKICATMKSCLPYLAGGDIFGLHSEFKPIPHSRSGTNNNLLNPQNDINYAFTPLLGESTVTPNTYRWISDWLFQYTLKYGNGTNTTIPLKRFDATTDVSRNTNKIRYLELGNEPNKYWIKTYQKEKICELPTDGWLNATKFTGAEYAAMASAVYDAHGQTISVGDGTGPDGNGGAYKPSIMSADPNMKLVLGGVAGIREYDWKFVTDMKQWFTTNRGGMMPFKVINFHHYNSSKWYGLPGAIAVNGEEAASPEEDRWNMGPLANVDENGIRSSIPDPNDPETDICKKRRINVEDEIPSTFTGKIDPTSVANPNFRTFKQRLVELKSKVSAEFPNAEIWMSEFGFDTNERSPYRAPKLKDSNGDIVMGDRQEVQGRFLVRTALEIASAGWDRAMIYDIRDENSGVDGSLFQSSGLLKDKANNYAPKKSYFYIYTMKEALKGTKFKEECLLTGDNSTVGGIYAGHSYNFTDVNFPRICKFTKNGAASNPTVAGEIVYAVWLPTKQNLSKSNCILKLPPNTTKATMVTTKVGDNNGVRKALTVVGNSLNPFVSIPVVTENPIYIRLGESITDVTPAAPTLTSATGVSCDAIKLNISTVANRTYCVYYYEKNDKEENGNIPVFDLNDPNLKLFSDNITTPDVLIGGLYLGHDKYHIFVTASANGNISNAARIEATTTSCSNNVIITQIDNATISAGDQELAEVLRTDNFSLCYPIRDYSILTEWVNFSPSASKVGFIKLVNAQGAETSYKIDLVSLLDGNSEGVVQLEWANQNNTFSTGWLSYETIKNNDWQHLPTNITASRIKITRLDNLGKIRKLILRGVPISNPAYVIACCGANEPNIKTITGNTTTSAEIAAGNLLDGNSMWDQRQVVKIDGTLTIDNYYVFSNNSLLYMAPGAKISASYGKNFYLFDASVQGCDAKWQGIHVQPGSFTYLYNTKIRDAEAAVYIKNNPDIGATTYGIVFNSCLEENVIGIQTDYGTTSNSNNLYVVGSVFDGNKRDLKPDYPGASYSYNPYQSLDGIVLQTNYSGYIGYPQSWGYKANTFQNMAEGIRAFNVNSLIQNCEFKNITSGKVTNPYWGNIEFYGGYGIVASQKKLTLKGLGNADNSPLTFNGVQMPIYASYNNFDIQDCKITTNLNNSFLGLNYGGIYAAYDDWTTTNPNIIKNNTISANGSGITVVYPNNATQIENNKIDCNNINTYTATSAGSNISAYGANYSIKNNGLIMGLLKRSNGININGVTNSTIENNTIISRDYLESAKSFDSTFLINILSSTNNFINRNSLTGVGGSNNGTPYNVGINMISSPNNSITCNSILDARIGITADANNQTGDSQSNPNIKGIAGNVFSGFNQGLLLRSDGAVLGVHNHKMNRWIGASSLNAAAEFKNTSISQFDNNRFVVGNNTSNGSNSSEINPTVIPGAIKTDVIDPLSLNFWFRAESVVNPFTCPSGVGANLLGGNTPNNNALQTRGDGESEFYAEANNPYVNRKIVEDAAKIKKDLNLTDALAWIMERDAYDYYKEKLKGGLPNTKALKEFFKKHDNSDIGALADLDKEWSKFQEEDMKDQRQKAGKAENRLRELADAQTTQLDFKKLKAMKDAKAIKAYLTSFQNDSILILQKQLTTSGKDYEDQLAKEVKKLMDINSRLSDNVPYVKYEKEINAIYFSLVIDKTKKMTKEEALRVREIAMMCLDVAGKAPFRARGMYLLITTEPLPDWSSYCKNTIPIRQIAPPPSFGLAIYPNPAKDNITVSIEEAQNTEGYQWQITDVAGSSLKLGKFNSNVETISTAELNSGIYMIRVVRDNEIVKVEKFTIIK